MGLEILGDLGPLRTPIHFGFCDYTKLLFAQQPSISEIPDGCFCVGNRFLTTNVSQGLTLLAIPQRFYDEEMAAS